MLNHTQSTACGEINKSKFIERPDNERVHGLVCHAMLVLESVRPVAWT